MKKEKIIEIIKVLKMNEFINFTSILIMSEQ